MPYYPNLRKEKKLLRQGYQHISGLDEAGRGSWAGPIVAGAVILDPNIKIKGIDDSKKLRAPLRKRIFLEITATAKAWATGIVSAQNVDKLGIAQANIVAMQLALDNLKIKADYFLADGLKFEFGSLPGQTIIKGDHKVSSIAAASIVAKVVRDALMDDFDDQYPQYGFNHHKGYGTNHHFQMLMEHGISKIHRKSFRPMKNLVKE